MATTKNSSADSKNRVEKVAIVGAGGWIGSHITKALLATGKHHVTAITRHDSTNVLPSGVAKASVDYATPSTITEALRGQDFLVISLTVRAPPETQSTLLRCAADAGVRWVMPNAYLPNARNRDLSNDMGFRHLVDPLLTDLHDLDLHAVVLSCGFWYEYSLANSVDKFGFNVPNRTAVLFDDAANVTIHTSTWPHCGAATAALLSLPLHRKDGTTGPVLADYTLPNCADVASFSITQKDMFDSLKRVTKTTDADWTITHESARARWENARQGTNNDGKPLDPQRAYIRTMYSRVFCPEGDGLKDHELIDKTLDLPKEDLDEWTAVSVKMANERVLENYGK